MRFTYRTLIGKEKPPLPVLFENLPILLTIRLTASSRIQKMMTHVLENPHFDPDGFRIGHAHVILGLLFKGKNKRPIALKHLTEARRILAQFGPSQKLTRVDTALAKLGVKVAAECGVGSGTVQRIKREMGQNEAHRH